MDSTETTLVEFCAGYGGIGLGLGRVIENLRTIAVCEIEAFAIENLIAKMEAGRIDQAPVWNDLKTFPSKQFHGMVDILSAGFPCQPFSCAGLRRADDDPRHLFPFIMDAVESIRPRFVFLENVEGLISAKLGSDCWEDPIGTPVLLHVCRELERRGYTPTWGVFSASETGAPHQRKRVFILGKRKSINGCGLPIRARKEYSEPTEPSNPDELVNCNCDGYVQYSSSEEAQSKWGTEASIVPRSDELADNVSEGLQRHEQPRFDTIQVGEWSKGAHGAASECRNGTRSNLWPSRPGEPQYSWEPPRTTTRQVKPSLGGDTSRTACGMDYAELCESCDNRVDELRLLGNGVVPATAAKAWEVLYKRLMRDTI